MRLLEWMIDRRHLPFVGNQSAEQLKKQIVQNVVKRYPDQADKLDDGGYDGFVPNSIAQLLKAQQDKDQYVISYVTFASPELLVMGSGEGPPGLQGEPDPETEEGEMRIPSYEAWKVAYWK